MPRGLLTQRRPMDFNFSVTSRIDRIAQLRRFAQRAKVMGYITRAQARIVEEHLEADPEIGRGESAGLIRELRGYCIRENPIRHLRVLPLIAIAVLTLGCEEEIAGGVINAAEAIAGPAPEQIKNWAGESNQEPCPVGNPSDGKIPNHCFEYPKPGTLYPDQLRLMEGLAWPQAQTDLIGTLGEPLVLKADGLVYRRWSGETVEIPCNWQGCTAPEVK